MYSDYLRNITNNPSTISDLDMLKLDLQIQAYRGKNSMGIDAELFENKDVREFIVHNGFRTYFENEFVLILDWSCE
jgi:hypothetical protein